MNLSLDNISILINIFFVSHFTLCALERSSTLKKYRLSRARLRLKSRINERKVLMRKIRENHKSASNKKLVYGFPWWPWFK